MQQISSLNWISTSALGRESYVAVQNCPVATDTIWKVFLQGSRYDTARNIKVHFVTVDNMANNGICTIAYGPFSYIVPQFTRKTFQLPDGSQYVQLTVTAGTPIMYFAETRDLLTDDANLYNISVAAGTNVAYPWETYTAAIINHNLAADANKNILFSRIGGQVFNLLPVGTIPNGYVNPSILNIGNGTLTIVPSGADLIIGVGAVQYTNAAPLLLFPGESITLTCDSAQWIAFDHTALFTDHKTGISALNADPAAGVALRQQQRGFNDVGLESYRTSATEWVLRSFSRVLGLWRRLKIEVETFQLNLSGSTPIIDINSGGSLANLIMLGVSQSGFITSNSGDVANGANLDMPTNQGGGGWCGFIIASNTDPANANVRTQGLYTVVGRGAAATFGTVVAINGGGGPCAFVLSNPAAGIIRAQNTYGAASHIDMAIFGAITF